MVTGPTTKPLADEVLTRLADQALIKGGTVPRQTAVDLGSPGGFLGAGTARRSPGWTVHTPQIPEEEAPDNLERVELPLPELPFDDESVGLITGAYLEGPMKDWSPELADEAFRVLAPGGTVALLFRGPSPDDRAIRRSIPESGVEALRHAGFDKVDEVRVASLDDGSWIYRLAGVKPG